MVKNFGFSVSMLALIAAATPFAARADTLAEAVAYAYDTNPNLQAQRAALRALDESYVQARSQFGLQASATAGTTYAENKRDEPQSDIFGEPTGRILKRDDFATNNARSLSIAQPLYTGGRLTARLKAAEAQIKSGREAVRRIEQDLLTRVVAAYSAVRRDEEIVRISQEYAAALEKQLQDSRDKYGVRQVTLTDVEQSTARLSSARTQLYNAQAQLALSRAQYAAVVGRAPGTLAPEPDLGGLPATLDAAFDAAELNSPSLLQAAYVESGSRARVADAKAARMPTISARADWQKGPGVSYLDGREQENLTGSVTVSQPIFSSGQISSVIRQAVQENVRDQRLLDDARRNVVLTVSQTWDQLTAARRSLVSQEQEVRSTAVALYGVRQEERFALRSTIEILNAQAELQGAEIGLVRGRYNEYVGRVQLLAAMGTLRPETLSPDVAAYDPVKNFNKVKWKGALPFEILTHGLDAVHMPDTVKPTAGDTSPIRSPNSDLPPAPTAPAKVKPLPSILELTSGADPDAPMPTNKPE